MELKKLDVLIDKAKARNRRLVVAAAADEPVLEAVANARKEGIAEPILVGDKSEIEKIAAKIGFDLKGVEIIHEPDPYKASVKAVQIIREGKADIMMKGLVATGPLLKAVLDKENGLRKGALISHVAFFESPYYHKLLCVTDAAMNVADRKSVV